MTSTISAWQTRAFAKINLHLEVLGRRPDGFHDLATVFQTIGLADTLLAEPGEGPFVLTCPGSDVPADGTNLVSRAAAALAEVLGRSTGGWRLTLVKAIPMQAGLGGGSADAMAALRLLGHVWDVAVEPALLVAVGSRLGSDVAFFAEGGTSLGSGRGEVLARLADLPLMHVVVARPSFGVSTGEAYAWVSAARASGASARATVPRPVWPAATEGWPSVLPGCWNDFEPVVCARHPALAALIGEFGAAGARHAFLSGSGSAVAALFDTAALAAAAAGLVAGRPGWLVWTGETLDRAAHARATTPLPVLLPLRSGYV